MNKFAIICLVCLSLVICPLAKATTDDSIKIIKDTAAFVYSLRYNNDDKCPGYFVNLELMKKSDAVRKSKILRKIQLEAKKSFKSLRAEINGNHKIIQLWKEYEAIHGFKCEMLFPKIYAEKYRAGTVIGQQFVKQEEVVINWTENGVQLETKILRRNFWKPVVLVK